MNKFEKRLRKAISGVYPFKIPDVGIEWTIEERPELTEQIIENLVQNYDEILKNPPISDWVHDAIESAFIRAAWKIDEQEKNKLMAAIVPCFPVSEAIIKILLEEDNKDEGYIAVDLDGTLAKHTSGKYKASKIGDPIPKMVARVRRWVGHGKKVKIFTARADDEVAVNAIKKWLKDNELPDLEITNLKDKGMTEFWDDRAVAVKKNTGEVKEDAAAVIQYLLKSDDEITEGVLLVESPEFKTLEKNQVKLEPEERERAMKAGAVWHFSDQDKPSCAIKKAVVKGKTWYWCNTHRCGQVRPTLKGAISAFDFVKTTA